MAVAGRINYGGMWACVSLSLPSKNYISSVWGEHMGRRQSDYYTSLPASQLLFLFFGRICYWSPACTGLAHSSITFWAGEDIMVTLIRLKITLTDNKGTRNIPGDMVQSNIHNQASCRPVFQLVFLQKTFLLSYWQARFKGNAALRTEQNGAQSPNNEDQYFRLKIYLAFSSLYTVAKLNCVLDLILDKLHLCPPI